MCELVIQNYFNMKNINQKGQTLKRPNKRGADLFESCIKEEKQELQMCHSARSGVVAYN